MNFQIRIRTDATFADICYVSDWLEAAAKGFAFQHAKPGNNHYHIYLFGLSRNDDAMRSRLGRYLPSKECYSVKTKAGKKNRDEITDMIAYQYAKNPKSFPTLVWMKGFTDAEQVAFEKYAKDYYDRISKELPVIATTADAVGLPNVIYKTDRVWERLRDKREDYANLTVKQIKSKLAAEWLNDGKAIMRSADSHRYAVSLYYLNKYKDEVVPDNALDLDLL